MTIKDTLFVFRTFGFRAGLMFVFHSFARYICIAFVKPTLPYNKDSH